MAGVWQVDVLGTPFRRRELDLGEDDEGPVVATLVHYAPTGVAARPTFGDVLYVHGWSDYFFQRHLARFWHRQGWRFFALDLRKYGRSLRPGQTPGLISDLATYDEDIAAARRVMSGVRSGLRVRRHGPRPRPLLALGHSTGGLILSLWAHRHPGAAQGVVLNSPWLEFQANTVGRFALAPLIQLEARRRPLAALPSVDLGYYTRTVSSQFDGQWDYDVAWRPERGFATNSLWLKAILDGHDQVARGLSIDAPVLTLLSQRSILSPRYSPAMSRADVALDVEVTAARATRLGPLVTVARLDGALHDVFLSDPDVRSVAYGQIESWLRGYLPL